MADATVHAHQ